MAGIEVKSFDKADEVNDSFNSCSSICIRINLHSFGKVTTYFSNNIKFRHYSPHIP